jgi:hypothetical protein
MLIEADRRRLLWFGDSASSLETERADEVVVWVCWQGAGNALQLACGFFLLT